MRSPVAWVQCLRATRALDKILGTDIGQRRRAEQSLAITLGTDPAGTTVSVHDVAVDGGVIKVYVYKPAATAVLPAHVYFHAGGYWSGSAAQIDGLCRELARAIDCVVVNVDYRLAPEHPFPTAPRDAYAAFRWTINNAAELGIDPSRVSVGGLSCGGALATVVTMMNRDDGGPAIAAQLLETPALDLTGSFRSMRHAGRSGLVTSGYWRESVEYYAPNPVDRRNPLASPVFATNLSGLPPAIVLIAQYDPFRDEAWDYVRSLRAAGGSVEVIFARNHVHSSVHGGDSRYFRSAPAYRAQRAKALRAALTSRS